MICVVMIADLFIIRHLSRHYRCQKHSEFVERIYRMHVLYFFTVPAIIFFSFSFYRISRNFLLLDYLCYSYYLQGKRSNLVNYITLFYILTGVYWSAVNMISQWNEILQNNIILGPLWL